MTTLSKIIDTSMDNNSTSNDRVGTNQLDLQVLLGSTRASIGISGNVSQVSNVSVFVFGGTVLLTKGVEVGASRSASVGVVTKLVNVESTESIGIIASNVPAHSGVIVFRGLLKVNSTLDIRVSSKNSDLLVFVFAILRAVSLGHHLITKHLSCLVLICYSNQSIIHHPSSTSHHEWPCRNHAVNNACRYSVSTGKHGALLKQLMTFLDLNPFN